MVVAALLVAWALVLPADGPDAFAATSLTEQSSAALATDPAGGEYVPLQPARIVDTRSGLGGFTGQIGPDAAHSFTVTGVGGVPTTGVSAVVVTVTVPNPVPSTWLAVYPTGEARPDPLSQLSVTAGFTESNVVIAKLGSGGKIDVYNRFGSVDVWLDVQGYFTDNTVTTAGGTFVPLSPKRIYDTTDVGNTNYTDGETRDIPVTGVGGVPATGVSAVAINFSVDIPTDVGFVSAFPAGTTRPTASTLNYSAGASNAALAQVKVGSGGKVSVYSSKGLRLMMDVEGYYLDNTQTGRDLYVPISPRRIYTSSTDLTAGSTRPVQVAGAKDSGGNVVVPSDGVTAVALSVTAAHPADTGVMIGWAAGTPKPLARLFSYNQADNDVTGTAILPIGTDGKINIYSSQASGLVVDVQGYFQSTPPPTPPAPSVTSSTHAQDAWTATAQGSFTFSSSSPAVSRYLYAVDDDTFATATSVTTSNGAPKTVAISPGDGWHTLAVRAVDFANNLSAVTSYQFGTTPGVSSPDGTSSTQRFVRLDAQAANGFTGVRWQYRQSESAAWRDIPTDHVTVAGNPVTAWPVVVTTGSGASADVPEVLWDMPRTIFGVEATSDVRACLSKAGSPDSCTVDQVTANLDKADVAGSSEDIGPGSLSLLSGNMALSETDASVDSYGSDLTVSRSFNTLKPTEVPAGVPQLLDSDQTEVEAGTAGYVAHSVSPFASTLAFTGLKSLKLTPNGTSGTDMETYASIGADTGGMRLGMKAAHTYTFTTQINVPAATGLGDQGNTRALQAVLFYKVGTGSYVEVHSNAPTGTDVWQTLRLRATLPAGTTEAFIRLYNGRASNATTKPVYYDNASLTEEGMYGPGWTSSISVDEADADWTGLTDRGEVVVVTDADSIETTFAKKTDGSYIPTGEDATSGLTLTTTAGGAGGPAEFKVGDLDANTTVFTPATIYTSAAAETVPHSYQLSKVVQPGSSQNTTYAYNSDGRISQMLAPIPPGVSGCGTWTAGCKALLFVYNGAGHVTAITFRTTTAAGADLNVDVACYAYDDGPNGDGVGGTGRLLQEWDPRTVSGAGSGTHPVQCGNPVLPTTYTYDTAGRVATVKDPGLAAWTLTYDTTGRISTAKRTHDAAHGSGTETTAIEYDLPLDADSANPDWRPDLSSAAKVDDWGQHDLPVTATAVYNPGHASSRTDLRQGTLSYFDADGRTVNAAQYAGTGNGGWAITTSEYDKFGNTIRELSAANRADVLAGGGLSEWKGIVAPDPGARALTVSTVSVYTADGQDLTDSYGPWHEVVLADGSQTFAREHTHNDYDTGTELAHPAGPVLHLVTTSSTAASLSSVAVAVNEQDKRTTRNDYALSTTDATGWTFRQPMRVVVDPAGVASTTTTRYDATSGLVIESRMPSEPSGGGPGTTLTVYYTAGTNSQDAACGNKPAWTNLVCVTTPANLDPGTAGLPKLVTQRVTGYDYLNRPLTTDDKVVDAGGTTRTRTTTSSYDNAGYSTRIKTTQISGGVGTAVPDSTISYDTGTGLVSSVTSGTAQQTTSYDDFGRTTGYTDAAEASGDDKNTVTTSYDTAGRIASVADAKGTVTNTYNGGGDNRDMVTSMTVTGITGSFAGTYDADGRLVEQTWPNGLIQTVDYDADGEQTSRRQVKDATWLEETTTSSVHGQTRELITTGANVNRDQTYTYDPLGRLTATQDNGSGQCLNRTYGFDANTNRTARTVYGPAADGSCQTGTAQTISTYTYDGADRLKPAGTHAALAYDAYGRITTLPAADTTAGTGNVTLAYYADDLVRSITQDGTTLTYTLDAAGRLKAYTNSATGATKTNHYDDPDTDSPDWISETTDSTSWTRNITDLSGDLAATINQAGTLKWQTVNDHGDVTATADNTATQPEAADTYATDEYGVPIGTNTPGRYGWLGGKQRSTDTLGGLTLMGVRLYAPNLGRFLQTDPVPGGSANAHDYANQDPLNTFDLDGNMSIDRSPGGWGGGIFVVARGCLRFCKRIGSGVWRSRRITLRGARWAWRGVKSGGQKVRHAYRFVRHGWEHKSKSGNWRFAPFGNRGPGRWFRKITHYHRRGKGPGQGIGRHRPWQSSQHDRSWWSRW